MKSHASAKNLKGQSAAQTKTSASDTVDELVSLDGRASVKAPIRIFMLDGHTMIRRSLCALLEEHEHMCVAGEASAGQETLQWLQENHADIIVLGLLLPNENGVDLLPLLQQAAPQMRIIVLTGSQDNSLHRRAVALGAHGLVLKEQAFEVLFKAIERVHAGEMWIDRGLMADVIADMNTARHKPDPEAAKIATLSPREREVIALLAQALKNKEIANQLFISETTVRHHLTSIFNKLEVDDRLELVVYAYRHKICVIE